MYNGRYIKVLSRLTSFGESFSMILKRNTAKKKICNGVGCKKGTGGSLSEAFIFTQRENTQVSTLNSVFGLRCISIIKGAGFLPVPLI